MQTQTIISHNTLVAYGDHKLKWSDCSRCSLCESRSNVVIARGKIPADILFIGEAPGESEDRLGRPFVGEAGKLLDSYLSSIEKKCGTFRYAITNAVACWPTDDQGNTRKPTKAEITACSPRLSQFVYMVKPLAYVFLGTVAQSTLKSLPIKPTLKLTHPASIFYQPPAKAQLSEKRFLLNLESFLVNLSTKHPKLLNKQI